MPELPEVETIRRGLEKKIVSKTIINIEIIEPKEVQGSPQEAIGQNVLNVWRKAKMLGIDLSSEKSEKNITLLFHLKMTGQLVYVDQDHERIIGGHPTSDMRGDLPNKSTRVIFEFEDNSKLYFNDQRKFGWVKVIPTNKVGEIPAIRTLGPEPLEKEFNWEILKINLLKHKSQPVKVALMDQSVVSGIGNIYASEALFDARVDPRRKVSTLLDEEFKRLVEGIKKSLAVSIEKGGSTRAHFVDTEGKKGYFLDYANVYGKEGKKCNQCPGKVEKITQAGRGTYFCPACQR